MATDSAPSPTSAPTPAAGLAPARAKPRPPALWLRWVLLAAVVALTVAIYLLRDEAQALARYGYVGIFLLSLLANATIILPAPGIAIVFTMAGVFPPFGVALAAAAGATLGELSGYVAGMSGQAIIENRKLYERFEGWMARYGALTVILLAFIPSPLFDLAGVAAGALKMKVYWFMLWCFIGKLGKMLVIAYFGAYLTDSVFRLLGG